MSYGVFLLAFVVPPIAALAALARRRADASGQALRALAVVVLAALLYTAPWDNYLVWRGVWTYGRDRVVGTIGYVPVEEYLFFVLQPVLVGLLFLRLRAGWPPDLSPPPPLLRAALAAGWLLVGLGGALLLARGPDATLYLGLILAWVGPVLSGMSLLGARHVWANRKAALVTLGVASLYLWLADRVAIGLGIWDIAPRYCLGRVLGLPIEEAVFFSATTWLCVQGLAMLLPERAAPVPA